MAEVQKEYIQELESTINRLTQENTDIKAELEIVRLQLRDYKVKELKERSPMKRKRR